MTDRAASEVLSFALVFALITSMVGLVSVAGVTGLTDMRDAERLTNAERALDVLADNVADVTHHGAPSRATEINLAGAQLDSGEAVTVNVSTDDGFTTGDINVRPIVYTREGTDLVYVNGAVIRVDDDGAVMKHQPALVLNESWTMVQVVQTTEADTGVGGSTTVLVRTVRDDRAIVLSGASTASPTVWYNLTTVSSARADAWRRYVNASTDATCLNPSVHASIPSTEAACSVSVTTDQVYVTNTTVDVTFE